MTLPQETLDGKPARAWCHRCEPVQAFESIKELQEHDRKEHGKR